MHVLYFLLKKLMEPPFSEYLVLLKNRVTFSYSFIFFVFSRKLFSQRYDEKYSLKIFFSRFWRKNLRKCFHEKDFAKKKLKNFRENFRAKKYITTVYSRKFAQNFFAIKFATIFFAIINNFIKDLTFPIQQYKR
jgi:TRAP-type C4-dicarboxylate transport system permease small subunit